MRRRGLFLAAGPGGALRVGNYCRGWWVALSTEAGWQLRAPGRSAASPSRPGVGSEESAPPGGRGTAPLSKRRPGATGTRRSGVALRFTWVRFLSWGHGLQHADFYIFPDLLRLSPHLPPGLPFSFTLLFPPLLASVLFSINLIFLQSLSPLEILRRK